MALAYQQANSKLLVGFTIPTTANNAIVGMALAYQQASSKLLVDFTIPTTAVLVIINITLFQL